VLDLEGGDRTGFSAGQFPPDGVADTSYYLGGRTRSLSPDVLVGAAKVSYDAATLPGQVVHGRFQEGRRGLEGHLRRAAAPATHPG